ncbi:MAG: sodium:solute symporter family protein, partial [Candidatus Hydrogenedentota bacterium]
MNDAEFVGQPIDLFVVAFYFVAVVSFGLWFGKYTKSTKDFFFGGQRFSWWLIAFSGVATTVGSYSFVKYSDVGFQFGL